VLLGLEFLSSAYTPLDHRSTYLSLRNEGKNETYCPPLPHVERCNALCEGFQTFLSVPSYTISIKIKMIMAHRRITRQYLSTLTETCPSVTLFVTKHTRTALWWSPASKLQGQKKVAYNTLI
jgi:hypothetical protein